MPSAISLRPAPMRPPMPRISPLRCSANEMSRKRALGQALRTSQDDLRTALRSVQLGWIEIVDDFRPTMALTTRRRVSATFMW
jgi:hypothetical protein